MCDKKDVSPQKDQYTFLANCALGLEELIEAEIKGFSGVEVELGKGTVQWQGSLETGYRACLWSRFSSRILLKLSQFEVNSEDDLYQNSFTYDWHQHMSWKTTFAIDCTLSADATVGHSQFAALRIKDGIVDRFKEDGDERPSVKTTQPDVRFHIHVSGNEGTLYLDLSGESLHKRGYRVAGGMAPLKENLAAGIVALSGWPEKQEALPSLIDPMCGTGTLLIEAAMMFGDVAPGLARNYFGFLHWHQHDSQLWQALLDEAVAREDAGLDKTWPSFQGYDADPVVVSSARKNIIRAGLDEFIQVKCSPLVHLGAPTDRGMLICNPPYGERLSETEKVRQLYAAFGRIGRKHFAGWDVAVFISNPDLAESFRVSWEKKYRLFNGTIACRLSTGVFAEEEENSFAWEIQQVEVQEDALQFANRFKKNLKKYLKWAKKENISCFRVYDRDLQEFNLSVDLYEKWIHVQEYLPPKTIDPDLASRRFNIALRAIREILGLRSDRVFIKKRQRQKGAGQYQQQGDRKKMHQVREGNCYFLVNFRDYLDTGLFLDHRPIRLRIGRESLGKKFLNLYGYTGTASVHAAQGGAASTTTVDLSSTYLQWTEMNFSLNGFAENNHRTVKADCIKWLAEETELYDTIFVDPPTFSNTQKANRVFDIQRDHIQLLTLAMRRLSPGGLLIFSTNFRRFILDEKLAEQFDVKDITRESIPLDFSRNEKIHFCWEFRQK
ncbi:bifunctional 23S rRNA (guanine(2069)-N(7))-methyltransferase RlmK/23S rRNA (guanine(2445)-N(2))-methyltransferase RlmL [Desulfotalea psychrophila]|uniref:Ribosomal RNA large subunit methyltransferase K/L n=1 Tax=Desulfotalea psychrophila (strain LSv54 / DSM 12343) TaxID=177439 RepID=RLMKL_DESPS|nr:bifunctional 23S rRNA (guanine(2069)-N(7))-methyltransferase RlmK/23S rRNA (guanine(2445)-N(2))-methyltransferase RlmL [Desulfotalea psychrophila]Q6AQA5.1 RecName: Full=Ribosomal RNA large subunit methyltransferase K/L; Includes: RecName: Full=23S rRNA m2G2445 methyltransferase; AltName: Full=rRNA (guanine-N(2)-)-methyltransferase RlmL; Includes: RecName: Full=23S rRNA m7G2069 methyltransferase; AltName: Full=rRNA (guanine-N(7)-)-methyltransferase RlmK [Desulfotalea psychrophila LSv54]CAG35468